MPPTISRRLRRTAAAVALAVGASALTVATATTTAQAAAPSCTLSFDVPNIGPGESATLSITGDPMLYGLYLRADGTGDPLGWNDPQSVPADISFSYELFTGLLGATTSVTAELYREEPVLGEDSPYCTTDITLGAGGGETEPAACTASFDPSSVGPGDDTDFTLDGEPDVDYWWYQVVDDGAPVYYTNSASPSGWNGFGTGYDYLADDYPGITSYTVLVFDGEPDSPATDEPACQATLTLAPAAEPQEQTITFASAPETHDLTWFMVTADADSELPVVFSTLTPEVCEVAPSGGVTPVSAGTCTVAADQEGDSTYAAAPQVTKDITITAYDQEVVFAPVADHLVGSGPVALTASSTMDLEVGFVSETPAICTVADRTAVLVAPGTCTIRAEQPGAPGIVNPASATRSFRVLAPAEPDVQVRPVPPATPQPAPAPQPEPAASDLALVAPQGVALSAGTASVKTRTSAPAPVQLSSTTPKTCTVNSAGKLRLLAVGTCTVAAAQPADATHRAGQVSGSFPVWGAPSLPSRARAADVVTVLGKGEDGYRVSASPAGVCKAVDGEVVLLDGGTCRISVRTGAEVVRAASLDVVVPAKPAATPKGLDLGVTVYFGFDSARLTDEGRASLREVARKLRAADLVVAYGHTYGPGRNSQHSRNLAARRAEAVVAYLDGLGVKSKAVTEVAMAMQQPVSTTAWKNRRVEVYFR